MVCVMIWTENEKAGVLSLLSNNFACHLTVANQGTHYTNMTILYD